MLYAFRNTPFKGVYLDLKIKEEICLNFPEASYRIFNNDEEKEFLKWASVDKISSEEEYIAISNEYFEDEEDEEDQNPFTSRISGCNYCLGNGCWYCDI